MPDPFKPRTSRSPTVAEQPTELAHFTRRLRLLGATADEVQAVVDTWDDFDADWGPEQRAAFVHATDTELAAQLQAVRDEHAEATTTPDEQADAEADAAYQAALTEAEGIIDQSVPDVLAWVGDDQYRAQAAYQLEVAGKNRKTLTAALSSLDG